MRPTVFQKAELRDENDVIVQQGTYGKGSALSNSTNDGWVDYVMNNLEFLYGLAKDEVVPVSALPASGDMNKTYLLTTTGVCYRWDGTAWVEISSSEAVGRAETAANLAEQWATKTDGSVDGTEYSAKYYAEQAEASADDAQDVADDMATHLVQIDQNTGGISANSKRIANIEKLLQGNLYDYDTDDDTAYTKSVPSGAMPYAGIESLGGKTVVMNQLCHNGNFANVDYWGTQNFTISASDNVLECVCGSANYAPYIQNTATTFDKSHTFYIRAELKHDFTSATADLGLYGVDTTIYSVNTSLSATNSFVRVAKIAKGTSGMESRFRISVSAKEDGKILYCKNAMFIDLTLMFGAGNEPQTCAAVEAILTGSYYAHNSGSLLSAGVTSVESVGKNLFNPTGATLMNCTYTNGAFVNTAVDSKTYFAFIVQYYNNDSYIGAAILQQQWWLNGTKSVTFTATTSCNQINFGHSGSQRNIFCRRAFNIVAGKTYTISFDVLSYNPSVIGGLQFDKFQIEESATATAYSPYMSDTYPIPTAIRNLEGYGWSAGTAYNYVDFERKVFVKNVGAVDLGSLTWIKEYHHFYSVVVADAKPPSDNNTEGNIVCALYVNSTHYNAYGERADKIIALSKAGRVFIYDSAQTGSASDFKTAMDGVLLFYELQTPIETDISQYLTDDNLISVESGGTLTLPNQNGTDYQIPVPSEEEYMIDLQSAIGG